MTVNSDGISTLVLINSKFWYFAIPMLITIYLILGWIITENTDNYPLRILKTLMWPLIIIFEWRPD